MEIWKVSDKAFQKYGKIIEDFNCSELLTVMEKLNIPDEVIYVPSDAALESCKCTEIVKNSLYGGMPIQIGYCNGHNKKLNALEYHRDSEINIAATDMILMLGQLQDVGADYSYDTSKVEAFLVPAGTVIEVYATTLHYAPCHVSEEGFKCIVVLPQGTNTEIQKEVQLSEDQLLFARNKWLIAHAESGLEQDGAFIGLKGNNITIK